MRFSAKNKKDLLEGTSDDRISYLIFLALSELVVFLLEDSTTIFVWCVVARSGNTPPSTIRRHMLVGGVGVAFD